MGLMDKDVSIDVRRRIIRLRLGVAFLILALISGLYGAYRIFTQLTAELDTTRDELTMLHAQQLYEEEYDRMMYELAEGYGRPRHMELAFPFFPNSDIHISSHFGVREHPFKDSSGPLLFSSTHFGLDIVSWKNTTIRSTVNGRVLEHYPPPSNYYRGNGAYGGQITIIDDYGIIHAFSHLSETHVKTGQRVSAGEPIGRQGDSGLTTGPHLHYEIRKEQPDGELVWFDPLDFFDIRLDAEGYVLFPLDEEMQTIK